MFFAELPSNGVSSGAKSSANDSAAKALDKNPASVTPIWIVAKNLLGTSNSFLIFCAFLSPDFASKSIFASFSDTNAISVIAKKEFSKMRQKSIIISDI